MFNLLLESADPAAQTQSPANQWWVYLILLGLVVVMLVLPMISNKKRAKEYNDMIDSISVGDTIRTVGGVIGRITKISEKDGYKSFILETGAKGSKTTMEFDMASVGVVLKGKNKPAEAVKEEPKAEPEVKEEVAEVKAEEVKTEEKPAEEKKAKKTSKKADK